MTTCFSLSFFFPFVHLFLLQKTMASFNNQSSTWTHSLLTYIYINSLLVCGSSKKNSQRFFFFFFLTFCPSFSKQFDRSWAHWVVNFVFVFLNKIKRKNKKLKFKECLEKYFLKTVLKKSSLKTIFKYFLKQKSFRELVFKSISYIFKFILKQLKIIIQNTRFFFKIKHYLKKTIKILKFWQLKKKDK